MLEVEKLDAAFAEKSARYQGCIAYIARAVNMCIEKGMIDGEHNTNIMISQKGMRLIGEMELDEKDLRASFQLMVAKGYLNTNLYYNMVFTGVVSRGETLH